LSCHGDPTEQEEQFVFFREKQYVLWRIFPEQELHMGVDHAKKKNKWKAVLAQQVHIVV
jgi:hypothetical protein